VGHSAGHITHLLLTTKGRKSGVERTVPLTYLRDGDDYVLVASNGGADTHPAWWLNLHRTPSARIQVGRQTVDVTARHADAHERNRLWPMLTRYNPFYANYERITRREIPVVILTPAGK
jgi:deazaflavin-dependent oxidoreductase (nitroreductase family)